MTNRIKRTSPLPVAPSALHKFLSERKLRGEHCFNRVELATKLGIFALEWRQALQAFVNMELMSYAGLDEKGIESSSLTKTGFAVWQYSRVNGRVTKDLIHQFELCLPHVAITMSQYPSFHSWFEPRFGASQRTKHSRMLVLTAQARIRIPDREA